MLQLMNSGRTYTNYHSKHPSFNVNLMHIDSGEFDGESNQYLLYINHFNI
jgi:hypothetical protein